MHAVEGDARFALSDRAFTGGLKVYSRYVKYTRDTDAQAAGDSVSLRARKRGASCVLCLRILPRMDFVEQPLLF
jgi:hypothetical protein